MWLARLKQYLNNIWHGENGLRPIDAVPVSFVVQPRQDRVWGIDISHWNVPHVDLVRMRDLFGLSFVIIKAVDGSIVSRYSGEHVANARQNNIPFGLYCWLYPDNRVSVAAQVSVWADAYTRHKPPMGVAIDAEMTYYGGVQAPPRTTDLQRAADMLAQKIGAENIIIYTSPAYARSYLSGFDFARYRLWIAHYGVDTPTLPATAAAWELWQFTSQLDGATLDPTGNKSLDGNYYNGTAEQFAARYGVAAPPQGGTMQKWKTITTLNLRPAPSISNTPYFAMPTGTEVWGDYDNATGWITVSYLKKPGEQYATAAPSPAYCSGSTQYVALQAYAEPPLPPAASRLLRITIEEDGWKPVTIEVNQERL